jgi:hypothetical protein
MAGKNKGGREIRKPKQVKTPKDVPVTGSVTPAAGRHRSK